MTPFDLQQHVRNMRMDDYPEIELDFSAGKTPGYPGNMGTYKGLLLDVVKTIFAPSFWLVEIKESPWCNFSYMVKDDWDCIRVCSTPAKTYTYPAGTCPKCGDSGEWRGLALVCRNNHGVFAG